MVCKKPKTVVKQKSKSRRMSKRRNNLQSTHKKQMGGSPASDLVMQASAAAPLMNDPLLMDDNARCQMGGGPGGDETETPKLTYTGPPRGGGQASDMVNSLMTNDAQTVGYPEGFNVKGNMNSLNLYAPSGGARKRKSKGKKSRKSHKSKSKSRKSKSRKSHSRKTHVMRGGSDWISSQYSLGPSNNPEAGVGDFSSSQAGSRSDYMNPPNLGLAGSGHPMGELEGGNVRMTGSPLV